MAAPRFGDYSISRDRDTRAFEIWPRLPEMPSKRATEHMPGNVSGKHFEIDREE